MDNIIYDIKPQHNSFTGNHDIIVLIAALQEKDKSTVVRHDRRNAASIIDFDGADDTLFATVLNVPVRLYAGLWKSRRWITWIVIFLSLVSSKILKRSGDFWIIFLSHGREVLLVMNKKE
jgi:josephin